MIFINFKTYEESSGKRAVQLVGQLQEAQKISGVTIIPVVQVVDAKSCIEAASGEVWIQHVDEFEPGKHTGWVIPEEVAELGIKGTFLNHSEHKLESSKLEIVNSRCLEVGLKTLIFASDIPELKLILELRPTYVSYESPELIASPDTSVAKAEPEIIGEAAKFAKTAGIPLIVGAGVKDSRDVKTSLELGAVGVAVSSAVVLSPDPKKVVLDLAEGFKR